MLLQIRYSIGCQRAQFYAKGQKLIMTRTGRKIHYLMDACPLAKLAGILQACGYLFARGYLLNCGTKIMRQVASKMPITFLCMANTPLTSNSACQKRMPGPRRQARLQELHVLYSRRIHADESRRKHPRFTRKKDRPLPISPGFKGHAALQGVPGVAFRAAKNYRQESKTTCFLQNTGRDTLGPWQ